MRCCLKGRLRRRFPAKDNVLGAPTPIGPDLALPIYILQLVPLGTVHRPHARHFFNTQPGRMVCLQRHAQGKRAQSHILNIASD